MLGVRERDELHRRIRDQDPDVWEPACHRLGEWAADDHTAYRALCDLLLASVPELRLKGLVALRIMAPSKPQEVLGFLTDRVADSRANYDPVLLDAIFFCFTSLPGSVGQKLVLSYLDDAHEGIRSAAAAALCFWREWPESTLERVARDPSVMVRASLISALLEMDKSAEYHKASNVLQQSVEPELKDLLLELAGHQWPPISWPGRESSFDRQKALLLLRQTDPTPVTVAGLENWVVRHPEEGLQVLRQGLSEPGGAAALKQLRDSCRESGLATLFRAWTRIVSQPEPSESRTLLLQVLGILEREGDNLFLSPFHRFVTACVQADDCAASLEMVAWSCTQHVARATQMLWDPNSLVGTSVAPEACHFLERLAETGSGFESLSLVQLSRFYEELTKLTDDVQVCCPRPERDLLTIVLQRWLLLAKGEIDRMMGGGAL